MPKKWFWFILATTAADVRCNSLYCFIIVESPSLPVWYYVTIMGPTLLLTLAITITEFILSGMWTWLKNWNVTPAMRQDCMAGCLLLAGLFCCSIPPNVDIPLLKWSQLEVLCFPRRMRHALCLSLDDGKKKIKTERETNNGKINRQLNLTPQETGFEPKQLGTQRTRLLFILQGWNKKVGSSVSFFPIFLKDASEAFNCRLRQLYCEGLYRKE